MPPTPLKRPKFNMDLRSRSYVFTVALLAAIALGLFFFRPRGGRQVVEAELKYVPAQYMSRDGVPIDPTATATITRNILAEIRDPAFVQAAVSREQVDLTRAAEPIEQVPTNISARIEDQDGKPTRLRIRFRAHDPSFGVSMLNAVARQFVAVHSPAAPVEVPRETEKKIAEARATVQQWQNRCQSLLAQRRGLMDTELARLRNAHPSTSDVSSLLDQVAPRPAPGFGDRPRANPAWVQLQNELKSAQDEVTRMLETYTPEHPAVLLKMSDIEAIRQELTRTERTVVGEVNSSDTSVVKSPTKSPYERLRQRGLERIEEPIADSTEEMLPSLSFDNEPRDSEFDTNRSPLLVPTESELQVEAPTSSIIESEPSPADKPELELQAPTESKMARERSDMPPMEEPQWGALEPIPADPKSPAEPAPRVVAETFDEHEARQTIVASEAYQQLEAKLEDATKKLNSAEATLADLVKLVPMVKQHDDGQANEDEFAKVMVPSRVVEVLRPPFNSDNLLQILGPATLFGFGLAVSRRPTPLPAFFSSESDVAESLGLSVISGVSKPKGPMFELPPNPTHKLVIACIRVSEIVIVASVMLIVMGLVLLPDFAAHMTSNPFDAFCIGLDHLEAFFKK